MEQCDEIRTDPTRGLLRLVAARHAGLDRALEHLAKGRILLTNSLDLSRRLDDLLWTYSDRTFLPHDVWTGEEPADSLSKILIGEHPAPDAYRELLVNLADQPPADLDRYTRIIEIVDSDPERKRLSRERYKLYRERGCALETHNL